MGDECPRDRARKIQTMRNKGGKGGGGGSGAHAVKEIYYYLKTYRPMSVSFIGAIISENLDMKAQIKSHEFKLFLKVMM